MTTADFLNLLAGMIGATPPPATAPLTASATPQASLNLDELSLLGDFPELSEDALPEDDTDIDDDDLSSDDTAAASALLLPLLPLQAMATVTTGASLEATADGDGGTDGTGDDADQSAMALTSIKAPAVGTDATGAAVNMLTQQQPIPVDPASLVDAAVTDDASGKDSASAAGSASSATSSNPHASHLQALAAAHAMQDADPAAPREIRAPMNTAAWTQELGNHLTWMAQHGHEAASLRLSPEHLGPLEIRISMREGEASVWFGAAHADTRHALEQSLPRLRELFASQGLALADTGVFKEAPRQQHKPDSASANSRVRGDGFEPVATTRASSARIGLVDTYV